MIAMPMNNVTHVCTMLGVTQVILGLGVLYWGNKEKGNRKTIT